MSQVDFVRANIGYARETEQKSGISHLAILAQAALESAWGAAAPGNMFFGVKDSDGINGNEQLLRTTEYSRRMDLKFPEIISVTPIMQGGVKMFKYVVRDYFRKYNTPGECFADHANFFLRNSRYKNALMHRSDPYRFFEAIAEAGYATDPDYVKKLQSTATLIESIITRESL